MTTPEFPTSTQVGNLMSRFPVAERDDDGNLIPFKPAQMLAGARAWHASTKLRDAVIEIEFHKADFLAALAEQAGPNPRDFNKLLTKYGIDVQVNERAAMTVWWRGLTLEERNAAMTFAREKGIVRMHTLRKHMEKPQPVTIDANARVIATTKAIDAPEPEPMLSFAQQALAHYPAPKGVHVGDLTKVLNMIGQDTRTWRLAKALHLYLAHNPALLANVADIEGGV